MPQWIYPDPQRSSLEVSPGRSCTHTLYRRLHSAVSCGNLFIIDNRVRTLFVLFIGHVSCNSLQTRCTSEAKTFALETGRRSRRPEGIQTGFSRTLCPSHKGAKEICVCVKETQRKSHEENIQFVSVTDSDLWMIITNQSMFLLSASSKTKQTQQTRPVLVQSTLSFSTYPIYMLDVGSHHLSTGA